MKRVFLLVVVFGLLFSGCKKEDEPVIIPDCELYNTGMVSIYNGFNEKYTLSINGKFWGYVNAYNTVDIALTSGVTTLLFKESDYIAFPTTREKVLTVVQCDESTVIFN